MDVQDYGQLTLFPEGSPASRFLLPGSDVARRMTVISGQKCLELYRKSGPLGSLAKTLLGSSIWHSTKCYLTWKASATPAKRLLFRLAPSTPRTGGSASPLWATPNTMDYLPQRSPESLKRQAETSRKGRSRPANLREQVCEETVRMWPTPRASDGEKRGNISDDPRNGLPSAVLWPTPTAAQCGMTAKTGGRPLEKSTHLSTQVYLAEKLWTTPTAADSQGTTGGRNSRSLRTDVGGQLNPAWVEWLMGFPIGWTDLDA